MIKFIQCVRKKPEISIQDFRRSWKLYQTEFIDMENSSFFFAAEEVVISR